VLQTPILFLIFNRPDTTKLVFESIRSVQPKYLYIAADGARESKEAEQQLCDETRAVVANIDWDCEVKTLFREQNLGCRNAVSSAIDWFFEQVEEGIILEDDCLPHPSFYNFCEENLALYRNDSQVMHISGDNFQKGKKRGEDSYYFSNYAHIWGWATWRRAWRYYDVNLKLYSELETHNLLQQLFSSKKEMSYWKKLFNDAYQKKVNTWDYQWTFAIWQNNGLSIIPNTNLVSNIGFGSGTHTTSADIMELSNIPTQSILPIKHPSNKIINRKADSYAFNQFLFPSLFTYFKARLKHILFK
jgi:hypothetical protein